jgi:hypothetical protein
MIRTELVDSDQDCTSSSDRTALVNDRTAFVDVIRPAPVSLKGMR